MSKNGNFYPVPIGSAVVGAIPIRGAKPKRAQNKVQTN